MFTEASFILAKAGEILTRNKMGNGCVNYGIFSPCNFLCNLKFYLRTTQHERVIMVSKKKRKKESRVQNQSTQLLQSLIILAELSNICIILVNLTETNRLWSLTFNLLVYCCSMLFPAMYLHILTQETWIRVATLDLLTPLWKYLNAFPL